MADSIPSKWFPEGFSLDQLSELDRAEWERDWALQKAAPHVTLQTPGIGSNVYRAFKDKPAVMPTRYFPRADGSPGYVWTLVLTQRLFVQAVAEAARTAAPTGSPYGLKLTGKDLKGLRENFRYTVQEEMESVVVGPSEKKENLKRLADDMERYLVEEARATNIAVVFLFITLVITISPIFMFGNIAGHFGPASGLPTIAFFFLLGIFNYLLYQFFKYAVKVIWIRLIEEGRPFKRLFYRDGNPAIAFLDHDWHPLLFVLYTKWRWGDKAPISDSGAYHASALTTAEGKLAHIIRRGTMLILSVGSNIERGQFIQSAFIGMSTFIKQAASHVSVFRTGPNIIGVGQVNEAEMDKLAFDHHASVYDEKKQRQLENYPYTNVQQALKIADTTGSLGRLVSQMSLIEEVTRRLSKRTVRFFFWTYRLGSESRGDTSNSTFPTTRAPVPAPVMTQDPNSIPLIPLLINTLVQEAKESVTPAPVRRRAASFHELAGSVKLQSPGWALLIAAVMSVDPGLGLFLILVVAALIVVIFKWRGGGPARAAPSPKKLVLEGPEPLPELIMPSKVGGPSAPPAAVIRTVGVPELHDTNIAAMNEIFNRMGQSVHVEGEAAVKLVKLKGLDFVAETRETYENSLGQRITDITTYDARGLSFNGLTAFFTKWDSEGRPLEAKGSQMRVTFRYTAHGGTQEIKFTDGTTRTTTFVYQDGMSRQGVGIPETLTIEGTAGRLVVTLKLAADEDSEPPAESLKVLPALGNNSGLPAKFDVPVSNPDAPASAPLIIYGGDSPVVDETGEGIAPSGVPRVVVPVEDLAPSVIVETDPEPRGPVFTNAGVDARVEPIEQQEEEIKPLPERPVVASNEANRWKQWDQAVATLFVLGAIVTVVEKVKVSEQKRFSWNQVIVLMSVMALYAGLHYWGLPYAEHGLASLIPDAGAAQAAMFGAMGYVVWLTGEAILLLTAIVLIAQSFIPSVFAEKIGKFFEAKPRGFRSWVLYVVSLPLHSFYGFGFKPIIQLNALIDGAVLDSQSGRIEKAFAWTRDRAVSFYLPSLVVRFLLLTLLPFFAVISFLAKRLSLFVLSSATSFTLIWALYGALSLFGNASALPMVVGFNIIDLFTTMPVISSGPVASFIQLFSVFGLLNSYALALAMVGIGRLRGVGPSSRNIFVEAFFRAFGLKGIHIVAFEIAVLLFVTSFFAPFHHIALKVEHDVLNGGHNLANQLAPVAPEVEMLPAALNSEVDEKDIERAIKKQEQRLKEKRESASLWTARLDDAAKEAVQAEGQKRMQTSAFNDLPGNGDPAGLDQKIRELQERLSAPVKSVESADAIESRPWYTARVRREVERLMLARAKANATIQEMERAAAEGTENAADYTKHMKAHGVVVYFKRGGESSGYRALKSDELKTHGLIPHPTKPDVFRFKDPPDQKSRNYEIRLGRRSLTLYEARAEKLRVDRLDRFETKAKDAAMEGNGRISISGRSWVIRDDELNLLQFRSDELSPRFRVPPARLKNFLSGKTYEVTLGVEGVAKLKERADRVALFDAPVRRGDFKRAVAERQAAIERAKTTERDRTAQAEKDMTELAKAVHDKSRLEESSTYVKAAELAAAEASQRLAEIKSGAERAVREVTAETRRFQDFQSSLRVRQTGRAPAKTPTGPSARQAAETKSPSLWPFIDAVKVGTLGTLAASMAVGVGLAVRTLQKKRRSNGHKIFEPEVKPFVEFISVEDRGHRLAITMLGHDRLLEQHNPESNEIVELPLPERFSFVFLWNKTEGVYQAILDSGKPLVGLTARYDRDDQVIFVAVKSPLKLPGDAQVLARIPIGVKQAKQLLSDASAPASIGISSGPFYPRLLLAIRIALSVGVVALLVQILHPLTAIYWGLYAGISLFIYRVVSRILKRYSSSRLGWFRLGVRWIVGLAVWSGVGVLGLTWGASSMTWVAGLALVAASLVAGYLFCVILLWLWTLIVKPFAWVLGLASSPQTAFSYRRAFLGITFLVGVVYAVFRLTGLASGDPESRIERVVSGLKGALTWNPKSAEPESKPSRKTSAPFKNVTPLLHKGATVPLLAQKEGKLSVHPEAGFSKADWLDSTKVIPVTGGRPLLQLERSIPKTDAFGRDKLIKHLQKVRALAVQAGLVKGGIVAQLEILEKDAEILIRKFTNYDATQQQKVFGTILPPFKEGEKGYALDTTRPLGGTVEAPMRLAVLVSERRATITKEMTMEEWQRKDWHRIPYVRLTLEGRPRMARVVGYVRLDRPDGTMVLRLDLESEEQIMKLDAKNRAIPYDEVDIPVPDRAPSAYGRHPLLKSQIAAWAKVGRYDRVQVSPGGALGRLDYKKREGSWTGPGDNLADLMTSDRAGLEALADEAKAFQTRLDPYLKKLAEDFGVRAVKRFPKETKEFTEVVNGINTGLAEMGRFQTIGTQTGMLEGTYETQGKPVTDQRRAVVRTKRIIVKTRIPKGNDSNPEYKMKQKEIVFVGRPGTGEWTLGVIHEVNENIQQEGEGEDVSRLQDIYVEVLATPIEKIEGKEQPGIFFEEGEHAYDGENGVKVVFVPAAVNPAGQAQLEKMYTARKEWVDYLYRVRLASLPDLYPVKTLAPANEESRQRINRRLAIPVSHSPLATASADERISPAAFRELHAEHGTPKANDHHRVKEILRLVNPKDRRAAMEALLLENPALLNRVVLSGPSDVAQMGLDYLRHERRIFDLYRLLEELNKNPETDMARLALSHVLELIDQGGKVSESDDVLVRSKQNKQAAEKTLESILCIKNAAFDRRTAIAVRRILATFWPTYEEKIMLARKLENVPADHPQAERRRRAGMLVRSEIFREMAPTAWKLGEATAEAKSSPRVNRWDPWASRDIYQMDTNEQQDLAFLKFSPYALSDEHDPETYFKGRISARRYDATVKKYRALVADAKERPAEAAKILDFSEKDVFFDHVFRRLDDPTRRKTYVPSLKDNPYALARLIRMSDRPGNAAIGELRPTYVNMLLTLNTVESRRLLATSQAVDKEFVKRLSTDLKHFAETPSVHGETQAGTVFVYQQELLKVQSPFALLVSVNALTDFELADAIRSRHPLRALMEKEKLPESTIQSALELIKWRRTLLWGKPFVTDLSLITWWEQKDSPVSSDLKNLENALQLENLNAELVRELLAKGLRDHPGYFYPGEFEMLVQMAKLREKQIMNGSNREVVTSLEASRALVLTPFLLGGLSIGFLLACGLLLSPPDAGRWRRWLNRITKSSLGPAVAAAALMAMEARSFAAEPAAPPVPAAVQRLLNVAPAIQSRDLSRLNEALISHAAQNQRERSLQVWQLSGSMMIEDLRSALKTAGAGFIIVGMDQRAVQEAQQLRAEFSGIPIAVLSTKDARGDGRSFDLSHVFKAALADPAGPELEQFVQALADGQGNLALIATMRNWGSNSLINVNGKEIDLKKLEERKHLTVYLIDLLKDSFQESPLDSLFTGAHLTGQHA